MAADELAEIRKQCITSLYLCTDNVSKYLEEQKVNEFKNLRSFVQSYCLSEAQDKVAFDALEKAKRETDSSNLHNLEDRFAKNLSSLAGKKLNVNQHPFMIEFNKRVEKGMAQSRENLDESDIAITESQDQYLDPITKKPISDPVKNTVCGHIYEKDSIMNIISRAHRTRCPVAGCGNKGPILAQHLIADDELKFRLTLTQHSTMIQERSIMDLDCST